MSSIERCDVVVIGAGLGGLAAAAMLAREGCSVVLVERHDRAGGYASSFRREGFVFEVSLHLLDAIGPGEPGRTLLESLGVGGLEFATPQVLRRELGADHDLSIPRGRGALEDAIGARHPRDRDGFSALLDLGASAQNASLQLDDGAPRELHDTFDRITQIARATASEVVRARIEDPALVDVLERFSNGWLGRPLDALRAPEFLVPWYSYHALTGGYPRGGSAALADALVRVIEAAGGVVVLGCGAARIELLRRRVEAVVLEDGRRIACKAVVSNVCPAITFGTLIDPQLLPPSERAKLERLEPSVSAFKMWIGTRKPIAAVAYETDLLATTRERNRFDLPTCRLSVVVPSALGAGFCEPDDRVLSVSTLLRADELDPGASRERLRDAVIARLEKTMFPGLSANVEVAEVATPQTFEKFTGNPRGAIYGGSVRSGALEGWRPGAETSIERLFLAGAWTQPGAGFTTVLRSGKRAARAVLRALIKR